MAKFDERQDDMLLLKKRFDEKHVLHFVYRLTSSDSEAFSPSPSMPGPTPLNISVPYMKSH